MKEIFENAELEVIELNSEEVIVVSPTASCGSNQTTCSLVACENDE